MVFRRSETKFIESIYNIMSDIQLKFNSNNSCQVYHCVCVGHVVMVALQLNHDN